jgi:hypothetical protein
MLSRMWHRALALAMAASIVAGLALTQAGPVAASSFGWYFTFYSGTNYTGTPWRTGCSGVYGYCATIPFQINLPSGTWRSFDSYNWMSSRMTITIHPDTADSVTLAPNSGRSHPSLSGNPQSVNITWG